MSYLLTVIAKQSGLKTLSSGRGIWTCFDSRPAACLPAKVVKYVLNSNQVKSLCSSTKSGNLNKQT